VRVGVLHRWLPAALLCALLSSATRDARGADPDPWFGTDKALHLGVSAGLAGGGYGMASVVYEERLPRFLWGGGVALAAGVGKECADSLGAGQASWKDLTWDAIGVAVGLGVAWLLDVAITRDRLPKRMENRVTRSE
jgi:putative lipoprotein